MNGSVPPIYCLTLAEEPWKTASAQAQFKALGINATFVTGFHGMTLGLRPTNPYQFDTTGAPQYIHIATVGCALSHLHMLKVALMDEAPEFICCEDDAEFTKDFKLQWKHLAETAPSELQVVQLESFPAHPCERSPWTPGLVRSTNYAHSAACIWWTREAAEAAVRLLRPVDAPYDTMLIRKVFPFVSHAIAEPQLAVQRTQHGHWPSSISGAPYDHAHDPATSPPTP